MKILYVLFRILFGLSLISLGVLNLKNLSETETKITKNIDNWKPILKGQDKIFDHLKNYVNVIAIVYTYSFGLAGLLVLLGIKGSGIYLFATLLLELTLVHSPIFNQTQDNLIHFFKTFAILGGVLNS
jgi:uncharacterized membrane protein YphA (DoxX/SURF4 family)